MSIDAPTVHSPSPQQPVRSSTADAPVTPPQAPTTTTTTTTTPTTTAPPERTSPSAATTADARRAASGREGADPRTRQIQAQGGQLPDTRTRDVRVGEVFGNARVTAHDVVMRNANTLPGQPVVQVPHDRYMLQLADGRRLSVVVPQTPPGGIPYGYDIMNNTQVNERRTLLRAVASADPRMFAGVSEVGLSTSGQIMAAGRNGVTSALGFYRPGDGTLHITPDGLHPRQQGRIQTLDILRHEGGHGVGYRLAPGVGVTQGFEAALRADGGRTTPYAQSFQGRSHLREAYAEAHRLHQADAAAFRAAHPAQAAIIERDLAALSAGITEGRIVGALATQSGARATLPAAAANAGARVLGGALRFLGSGPVLAAQIMLTPSSTGGTRQQRPDVPDQPALERRARALVEANPSLPYPDAVVAAAREQGRTLPRHFIEELRVEARDQADAYAAALSDALRREQQRANWRDRGRVAGANVE